MPLLEQLPPPLLDDFLRGRWVPIIGAGYSKNARLSTGRMPDWQELADDLTGDLPGYEPQNAIDAISAYEEEYGRPRLIERLNELLHIGDVQPGAAHESLVRAGFDLVVTTNFDYLIERAYQGIPRPCQPLLTEAQLSQGPLKDQAQLLKLHGDLNHPDELVATEEDFDGFLHRRPLMATFTANLLVTRTPVLLGYSFDDPDTRSLWTLIRDRLGKLRRQGYVIKLGASPTEVARFARRGIKVVNLPKGDYYATFAQLFDELHAAYVAQAPKVTATTEDEVAAELVLPVGVPSRLCFCSVPLNLLPWYRREVFPVVEEFGYVTVTRDEVLSPGANAAATIDALLARAQLALLDISSFSTSFELHRAVGTLGAGRVVAITDQPRDLPVAVPVLLRTGESLNDPSELLRQLRQRLNLLARSRSQPQELLDQGHYNAAVVVAFGLLEEALVGRLDLPQAERPPSLMWLIKMAADQGFLEVPERERFGQWVGLRNVVVHGNVLPDENAARAAVAGIEELIARLNGPPS